MVTYEEFANNCNSLKVQIAEACKACGREPNAIQLLPVTKTHPIDAVSYAQRYGFKRVGENKVQEAVGKIDSYSERMEWELIGHLQSNKAKVAAKYFSCIQSVDSEKLLRKLNSACQELNREQPLEVLLQVNAGNDPAKYGVTLDGAPALLEMALACDALNITGLMTVAPLDDDPDSARKCFEQLRLLRDRLESEFGYSLPELSMGMTNDLAEAIAAGSTQIRIGTALFGARG